MSGTSVTIDSENLRMLLDFIHKEMVESKKSSLREILSWPVVDQLEKLKNIVSAAEYEQIKTKFVNTILEAT